MSEEHLNSAKLHLSEAADLAKTMADGFAMKRLTRALNRCTPITQHPAQPPASYGENPFEGGNVGAQPQSPHYSVGSYPEGRAIEANFASPPLPRVEYPQDTIPPALPRDVMTDPCAGMRESLAACAPPSTYCPSFMGQPTGEIPPLAGSDQPLDTYDSFANRPGPLDPSASLNDTLRQLWLRQHLQDRTQENQYAQPSDAISPAKAREVLRDGSVHGHPLTEKQRGMFGAAAGRDDNAAYAQGHKPPGPGGGQFTSGDGGSGGKKLGGNADPEVSISKQDRRPKREPSPPQPRPAKTSGRPDQPGGFIDAIEAADLVGADRPGEPGYSLKAIMEQAEDRARRGKRLTSAGLEQTAQALDTIANSFYRIAEQTANDGIYGEDRAVGVSRSEAAEQASNRVRQLAAKFRALANLPTKNSAAAYSYPQNPDGRAQGPMTAIPEEEFLGGRFGPGIKHMREQLAACRR